jgi:hypothetical protein
MGLAQDMRKLYTLETLDTRFVVPSDVPLRNSMVQLDGDDRQPEPTKDAQPSLWRSTEFIVYYVLLWIIIPIMIWIPIQISKRMYIIE